MLEDHAFPPGGTVSPLRTSDKLSTGNNNLRSGRGHKACPRPKRPPGKTAPALFHRRLHAQPLHCAKESFTNHTVNLSYIFSVSLHHDRVRQLIRVQHGPTPRGSADHVNSIRLGSIQKHIFRRLVPPQGESPGLPAVDPNRRKSFVPEQSKRKAFVNFHIQLPGARAAVQKPPGHTFNPAGPPPE